jgi:tetratricopeptide (TPR) repeat protein
MKAIGLPRFSRPQIMLMASAAILASVAAYRFVLTQPAAAPTKATPPISPNADLTDAQVLRTALGTADTASTIAALQGQIKANPQASRLYAQLGWAFVQRARENADPTNYAQAQQAFNEALKRDPQDVDALLGQGSVALSLHQFEEAIGWGEKAKTINPWRAQVYGVIGDGQVELGQYETAINTIQKMVDTRPDLSSYSRVSYVRELHGDVDGAITAMKQAVQAGNPQHEGTLWSVYQLGNLYFNKGDLKQAEQSYQFALQVKPDYVYARAGMAKIWAAQGQTDKAINEYKRINEALPLPEFVIALGDLYEASGKANEAKAQFDLVRAIQQLNASAEMDVDMEMSLFEADHASPSPVLTGEGRGGGAGEGLVQRARAAYERRPSIYAADALAWALFKNGEFAEAKQYSIKALSLGTKDALLHFHVGMIAQAAGDAKAAKQHLQTALQINPYFSVRYAPQAKAALDKLN